MEIVKKTIRDIASLIKTGKTPPSKEERYYNGNINWYTPSDLDKEKFLGKSNRTITEEAVAEKKATILPKHTVVIGAIGDIGKLGITSIESCTNQQITGIRTNEEIHFEYFYYWLKANKQLLQSNAKNAILPILNNESIRAIKIQFPKNIDQQKRIAKVLSQCEALLQKRKESIDLLDDLLKSTFLEMFGDPVRNEKGWGIESLMDFGNFKNGLNYTSNEIGGNFKYLGVGDFKDKWLLDDIDSLKSISLETIPSDGYFLKNGDLVFVRSNGNKQLVGRCIVVYPNNTKVTFSGFCIRFRPENTDVNPIYLAHLFRNQNFKLKMLNSGRGANIQNINQELLSNLEIPIPPPDLQTNFAHIVTNVEAMKKLFNESLKELENLFGSISQRAFNGELDLSKVDISDMEDSKKNDLEEVNEDLTEEQFEALVNSFELTLPTGEVPSNRVKDIRNVSIRQYLGYPEDDDATKGIEFSKMDKDYFYQFILTQGFADKTFTLHELERYARKYILRGTGFEFTYDNWKTILFRFIGAKQPIIDQVFDENDKTIKLKLTDEAFKV